MKNLLHIIAITIVTGINSLIAKDGVYVLRESTGQSGSTLPGGQPAEIDRALDANDYDLRVESESNWNDQFNIHLALKAGAAPPTQNVMYLGILVDDKMIVEQGGNHVFNMVNASIAERIAALGGTKPWLRAHPNSSLMIRFTPDKPFYKLGEEIGISIVIKNIGKTAMSFQSEVQIEKRSTAVSIMPLEGSILSLKDVRNPHQRMTLLGPITSIKTGEKIQIKDEKLSMWYMPESKGVYSFIGGYNVKYYDPENASTNTPLWVEWLGADFSIDIR